MRKFALRHRGGVIVTALLTMATLASLVLALWFGGSRRASRLSWQACAPTPSRHDSAETALKGVRDRCKDFSPACSMTRCPACQSRAQRARSVLPGPKAGRDRSADAPEEAAVERLNIGDWRRSISSWAIRPPSLRPAPRRYRYAAEHLGTSVPVTARSPSPTRLRERAGDPPALADMEQVVKDTPTDDPQHRRDRPQNHAGCGAQSAWSRPGRHMLLTRTAATGTELVIGGGTSRPAACGRHADRIGCGPDFRITRPRAYGRRSATAGGSIYSPEHHVNGGMALQISAWPSSYLGHFQDALITTPALHRLNVSKVLGNANYLRTVILANPARAVAAEALAVHERVLADSLQNNAARCCRFRPNYAKELVQDLTRPRGPRTDRELDPTGRCRAQPRQTRAHAYASVIASSGDHDAERALSRIDQGPAQFVTPKPRRRRRS